MYMFVLRGCMKAFMDEWMDVCMYVHVRMYMYVHVLVNAFLDAYKHS